MRGRCRHSSSERTEDMYQDTYVEQVVKKVLTKKDYTIKNILMALTIFFGLATVFAVHFICLILFIVCVILFYRK